MGDDDKGDAGFILDVGDFELGVFAQFFVERCQWFIEQQDFGLFCERARKSHALALATGNLVWLAARQRRQLDEIKHFPDAITPLRVCHILVFQAVSDVFFDAHMRKERIGLEHHIDRTLIGRGVGYVLAIDENAAGTGCFKTCEHPQQRCFSATGAAEESE